MADVLKSEEAHVSRLVSRLCGRHIGGAGKQRLAVQAAGDAAGFLDGRRGGVGVAGAPEVLGVVEEAVGEVVGGALLAQAGDGG
jgi:hypothetical protein